LLGFLQIIKLLFTFIKQFIICVLSNSISEVVNREVIDSEVNDIDNETLNNKINTYLHLNYLIQIIVKINIY